MVNTKEGRPAGILMTVHFRLERFCDGYLAAMRESGHLAELLRMLGKLAEAM